MRRGGQRPNRRGGSSASYTPRADPLNLLWWDPSLLTPGAVSPWTDRIAAVGGTNGTGAQQPTASATSINSAYPGVTGDGGDLLTAAGAGAVLTGKTTLTIVAAMVDATTGAQVALEYTANYSANPGGHRFAVNTSAGTVYGGIRGASGATIRSAADTLATARVVAIGYSYATNGADAIPFIRINGVAQSLTNVQATNAAGSAANSSLHMFALPGPSSGWAGTFGHIVYRNSVAEDAGLAQLERFVGARAGIFF